MHVGDVVSRDGDIVGDGVNIASRIDDLRRAGKKASDYRGPKENVVKGDFRGTVPEPSQTIGNSRVESEPLLS